MEAFARSLSLVFMKVPGKSGQADDYTLDHSAAVVLLDPQARMAGVIQPPFDVKAIAADLQALTRPPREPAHPLTYALPHRALSSRRGGWPTRPIPRSSSG